MDNFRRQNGEIIFEVTFRTVSGVTLELFETWIRTELFFRFWVNRLAVTDDRTSTFLQFFLKIHVNQWIDCRFTNRVQVIILGSHISPRKCMWKWICFGSINGFRIFFVHSPIFSSTCCSNSTTEPSPSGPIFNKISSTTDDFHQTGDFLIHFLLHTSSLLPARNGIPRFRQTWMKLSATAH